NTSPGPIGSPAFRRTRPKCITFSTRRPPVSRVAARSGRLRPVAGFGMAARDLLGRKLGLDLFQDALRLAALETSNVVLVFQEDAESVVDRLGIEDERIELHQGMRPVDGFGNARQLEEIHAAD